MQEELREFCGLDAYHEILYTTKFNTRTVWNVSNNTSVNWSMAFADVDMSCITRLRQSGLVKMVMYILWSILQIAVEGNIASGKTTLLNIFAKQYSAEVSK